MVSEVNDISCIRKKLEYRGYKFTKQRFQIIKVIYKNNKHISADEIYRKVKNKNIGLSTVYRNLIIFEEIGILKKINITNISYYELTIMGKYKFHIHAKCVKCNKIVDINEEEISEGYGALIGKLKERHEILVESTSVVLSGVCKDCEMKLRMGQYILK